MQMEESIIDKIKRKIRKIFEKTPGKEKGYLSWEELTKKKKEKPDE